MNEYEAQRKRGSSKLCLLASLCITVTCSELMEKWGLLLITIFSVLFFSFLFLFLCYGLFSFYMRYLVAVLLLVRAQYFIQIVGRQLVIRVAPARGRSALSRQLFWRLRATHMYMSMYLSTKYFRIRGIAKRATFAYIEPGCHAII